MNTTTLALGRPGWFAGRTLFDWLFAALVAIGGAWSFQRYQGSMDVYEQWILVGAIPAVRSGLVSAFPKLAAGRDSATSRRLAELSSIRQAHASDLRACRG